MRAQSEVKPYDVLKSTKHSKRIALERQGVEERKMARTSPFVLPWPSVACLIYWKASGGKPVAGKCAEENEL